jgi:hypothetical protein
MMNWISELWCKAAHSQPMWPIHGKYICSKCLREYPVAWEAGSERPAPAVRAVNEPVVSI